MPVAQSSGPPSTCRGPPADTWSPKPRSRPDEPTSGRGVVPTTSSCCDVGKNWFPPNDLRFCCRDVRRSRAVQQGNIPRAAAPRLRPGQQQARVRLHGPEQVPVGEGLRPYRPFPWSRTRGRGRWRKACRSLRYWPSTEVNPEGLQGLRAAMYMAKTRIAIASIPRTKALHCRVRRRASQAVSSR